MATSHTSALTQKHAGLDAKIHAELQRPTPDQTRLTELKRQKLKIKEQIASG